MSTFNEVAAFQSALIRKGLKGVLLAAEYSVPVIDDIAAAGGVLTIPAGYESFGKLSTAGVAFESKVDTSETKGLGDHYPARIDVTGQSSTMGFSPIETKASVLDAFFNVDQTNVEADMNTGTVQFDTPALQTIRDKRVLGLFLDINKTNGLDIYFGIHYPRANIIQDGSQTLGGDDPMSYPMTANALDDDAAGTPTRLFWGGPGLAGLLADMGYTTATA